MEIRRSCRRYFSFNLFFFSLVPPFDQFMCSIPPECAFLSFLPSFLFFITRFPLFFFFLGVSWFRDLADHINTLSVSWTFSLPFSSSSSSQTFCLVRQNCPQICTSHQVWRYHAKKQRWQMCVCTEIQTCLRLP